MSSINDKALRAPKSVAGRVGSSVGCRTLSRALRRQGCFSRSGKGDHEIWYCPCGRHMAVVTTKSTVSPGLVRQVVTRLECLPKGWLR